MNEKIKAFLQKVAQDEQLAAKLSACKTPEEAYAVASGVVEGFSKEEFVSTMAQVKAAEEASTTLSEEDIGKMAGGDVDWDAVTQSVISSAATSAGAIAAASASAI